MKHVDIYTDGACKGNPGPGGWAAILRFGEHERAVSGGAPRTTNNRMEITAVIEGLRAINERCDVTVYTDSEIVANCGAGTWKRKTNQDLWEQVDAETRRHHRVRYTWVRGHDGHEMNERADRLASDEAKKFSRKVAPARAPSPVDEAG